MGYFIRYAFIHAVFQISQSRDSSAMHKIRQVQVKEWFLNIHIHKHQNGKEYDLSDFVHGLVVCGRQNGLSIEHTQNGAKEKKNPVASSLPHVCAESLINLTHFCSYSFCLYLFVIFSIEPSWFRFPNIYKSNISNHNDANQDKAVTKDE